MILHFLIIVCIALIFLFLLSSDLIQVDLSLPWLLALIILGFLSIQNDYIFMLANLLKIKSPPIAIIFLTIFLIAGLTVTLLICYTKLRNRHLKLIRKVCQIDLDALEKTHLNKE